MIVPVTKKLLLELHQQKTALEDTFLGLAIRSFIKEFNNKNLGRIKSISEEQNRIVKKYFEFDGDVPKTQRVNEKLQSVLKEGMTMEMFMEEKDRVLNEQTVMEI